MKDLIIVGAGPAGLSAAIYGIRAGIDLSVVEKFSPGGQVVNTYEVENYPGFVDPVSGWDLMSKMEAQTKRLGAEIINGDIKTIKKDADKNIFILTQTDGNKIECRSVIIASGASFRKLGAPGEKEFLGRGVSYCATCDGAFYREKIAAVVGGGNTALEEAIFLTRFAGKVYLIHRRDEFRADKILQDRINGNSKIETILDTTVQSINGTAKVESLLLKNKKTGAESNLITDGVFIFVGFDPNTSIVTSEILNDKQEVIVDMNMNTAIPGLFAAGDLRSSSKRQIVMACADGSTAAMEAYNYLNH